LPPGEVEPVPRRVLLDQLGVRFARELGLLEPNRDRVHRAHKEEE
jgi:hypothetical protein